MVMTAMMAIGAATAKHNMPHTPVLLQVHPFCKFSLSQLTNWYVWFVALKNRLWLPIFKPELEMRICCMNGEGCTLPYKLDNMWRAMLFQSWVSDLAVRSKSLTSCKPIHMENCYPKSNNPCTTCGWGTLIKMTKQKKTLTDLLALTKAQNAAERYTYNTVHQYKTPPTSVRKTYHVFPPLTSGSPMQFHERWSYILTLALFSTLHHKFDFLPK